MTAVRKDIVGRRFVRLVVIRRNGRSVRNDALWLCRCDCGREIIAPTGHLISGNTKSCGCLKNELIGNRRRTHSMSRSPEYRTWCLMRARCGNPNNPKFADYGGRGIAVCEAWRDSFPAFLAAVGTRPFPRAEIERIDNDRGYEPGNVRWATRKEQTRNKRTSHLVTYMGKTQCISAWAEELGLDQRIIWNRLHRGCPLARALSKGRLIRQDGRFTFKG